VVWLSVNGTSRSGKPETSGEEVMTRARWRQVRQGHEKEDRAYNEDLAEKLLSDPAIDDIVIGLGLTGWKLVGPCGERWPMAERTVLVPSWAVTVAEQARDVRRCLDVVGDRHQDA
jgi:hypothetical protein